MKTNFFLLALLLASLTACKKDYIFGDITPNTDRAMVEWKDAKEGGLVSLSFSNQMVTTNLTDLRFNPRSKVSQNAVVKFSTNNTIISDFNNANGTNVQPLPQGSYTLDATELTLTPEERVKGIPIKILPSAIAGGVYALGLTISSTSYGEISSIAKDIIVFVKVKNDYEGLYYSTGQRTLYSGTTPAAPVSGVVDIDTEKYLYTVDQTTVETDVADLVGSAWMFLQVDPVTNNVTVKPSTLSPTFQLSNNGSNTYNPSTKTFSLNYKYYNSAGNLREVTETIVMQ